MFLQSGDSKKHQELELSKKMTSPKFKPRILMLAAEAAPYASVGGAGQVMSHLSKALCKLGYEVALFIPKFGFIDETKYKIKTVYAGLKVPTDDENTPFLVCNVKEALADNCVRVFFLENQEYYEKRANVYGYSDDPTRWALLSRGALEFVKTHVFTPDIIHCNDWHTGALPNYLKTAYAKDPDLSGIATIFTIHNLAFQGMFDHKHVTELDYDDGKSRLASFFAPRLLKQNFMKRGILYSDVVNTVSKTYAKEILSPELGEGLDKLLQELKGKIFGIVNGIDYNEKNPATDSIIERNYDINSLELRVQNKAALQREYDLPVDETIPVLGFVGRLDHMKGVDLLIRTLRYVMRDYNIQFVQVGGGDGGISEMLRELKNEFPNNVGVHPYPNFSLPSMLFAGTDCMIAPSRFEPCGIVQLESMRYGAIPIVRRVGGLADTVVDFDSSTGKGTGFMFSYFDEFSLYGQLVRALEVYKNKNVWTKLQKNAMKADFSWDFSAKEYVRLYLRAITLREKELAQPKDKQGSSIGQ
jgi:starch synthase